MSKQPTTPVRPVSPTGLSSALGAFQDQNAEERDRITTYLLMLPLDGLDVPRTLLSIAIPLPRHLKFLYTLPKFQAQVEYLTPATGHITQHVESLPVAWPATDVHGRGIHVY